MRPDLAAAFLRDPFGHHGRELQDLLNRMRGAPAPGKHFLYLEDAHRHWRLARFLPELPLRWELLDRVFDNIEDAERHVFRLRWREQFGADPAAGEPEPGIVSPSPARRRATVLGYADRRAVGVGEAIAFKVACRGAESVRLDIVRLDGPDLPGLAYAEPVLASADLPAVWHDIDAGSRLELDDAHWPANARFELVVKPTMTALGAILRHGDLRVVLDGGRLSLAVGSARATGDRLPGDRWLKLIVETTGESVRLAWRTVDDAALRPSASGVLHVAQPFLPRSAQLTLAGDGFNGMIEYPRLLAQDESALIDLDFSADMASDAIVDRANTDRRARLINHPTRAVPGHDWSGRTLEWPRAPDEYGAIHFHHDDIDDARWPDAWTFRIPREFAPGCYAARLTADDAVFHVPFFVRDKNRPRRTTLLMPTMTYAAYANLRVRVTGAWNEMIHGRLTVLDATDLLMLEIPELGSSTYDIHADDSHVVHASMDRPVTNFRPNGRIYKFCQDLLLVHWLNKAGVDWQPVSDDELHDDTAALDGSDVLITSSHPEYMTTEVRQAIDAFLERGGRLMYLGGNGFFWRCARRADRPEHVEVRRVGLEKLWQGADLSGCFSATGEPVGTWERVGWPPNATVGVGFVTQGFDSCEAYRPHPAAQDPRDRFIFDGVADGPIGDFGILMGGAAGYEIDRFDQASGSPAHALVLASSRDHTLLYDLMIGRLGDQLPQEASPVRADMVFFETPAGGAVFSVGSIAWSGSLAHNGYNNNVAGISDNVLRRFLDPTKFIYPTGGEE